jgi:glycogen debranching enzyme
MPRAKIRWQRYAGALFLCALIESIGLYGQSQTGVRRDAGNLAWNTDSTGPRRFISVHGRRAALFGYPQGYTRDYSATGLEVWAYPLQILQSYGVAFRQQGVTTSIDGETILRRILYSPEAVTRVYAGPDFIVREKLFVPLDEPGAMIRYEVESKHPIEIEIRFIPVLDLMWPASIGGQETRWDATASAYVLSELTHQYTASVGSPDVVAHDETPNIGQRVARAPGLAFTIRAGGGHNTARVIIAGSSQGHDAGETARKLLEDDGALEQAARHYADLLNHALRIETPDTDVNRALSWAEVALDQAWVCNPDLGCGVVAGYGPSRKARRPQYDWFFAGDGMVAVQGLLAAGEYERARQELEFIVKSQDQANGMIWHEQSQSAGRFDWKKYPYMFVHVDLTFDFLNTVGSYFSATGDREFVNKYWASIHAAYQYCQSLIDSKDGLPRIPSVKEGGKEQDALTDELGLSVSWAEASQAYADLSAATGHNDDGTEAANASKKALHAIGPRYWNEHEHSWISGYTRSGTPLVDRGMGPARVKGNLLLPEAQLDSLFATLASSDFQADWGMRGNASSARTYDPDSYSKGSVWATSTAGAATEFWAAHRPATALPIWRALVPWSSLDSLGHMHEVLAGDFYHEELESVPEQTWSSAAFFTAAVQGLLGIQVDGAGNRLTFAQHLPAAWDAVTVHNLRVGASEITLKVVRSDDDLRLAMQNKGAPVEMVFDPEIPFGATLRSAKLGNHLIDAKLDQHSQDTHAKVQFSLAHGETELTIRFAGGVAIIPEPPKLLIGDASQAVKITGVNLKGRIYTVEFDYLPQAKSVFDIRTSWGIEKVTGASALEISPRLYRLAIDAVSGEKESAAYRHGTVVVKFATDENPLAAN